jgi:hypothetical protein
MLEEMLAAVGMTIVIKNGTIFSPMAFPLHKVAGRLSSWVAMLLSCALCLGFWSGAAIHYAALNPYLAVCCVATGVLSGMFVGLAADFFVFVSSLRQVVAWAILGAILALLPVGCMLAAVDRDTAIELFLAGLRSAPVCLLVDLTILRLDR